MNHLILFGLMVCAVLAATPPAAAEEGRIELRLLPDGMAEEDLVNLKAEDEVALELRVAAIPLNSVRESEYKVENLIEELGLSEAAAKQMRDKLNQNFEARAVTLQPKWFQTLKLNIASAQAHGSIPFSSLPKVVWVMENGRADEEEGSLKSAPVAIDKPVRIVKKPLIARFSVPAKRLKNWRKPMRLRFARKLRTPSMLLLGYRSRSG